MKIKNLFWTFAMLLLIPFAFAAAPTHTNPLLQEVIGGGLTNLTGVNQSGSDADGDVIVFNYELQHKNIVNGSRWINDTRLIAAFPFDQNNYSDFSSRGNHLIIGNAAPSSISDGYIEGGFDFERGSYQNFNAENNFGLTTTDDFTVVIWFKAESISTQDSFFSTSASDTNAGNHFAFSAPSSLMFGNADTCHLTSQAGVIATDTWTFTAVRYNGSGSFFTSNVGIWVNGEEITLSGACNIAPQYPDVIRIGRELGVAGQVAEYFDGVIGEIYFYKGNLSHNEINQIYRGTRDKFAQINASRYTGIIGDYKIRMAPYDTKESGVILSNSVVGEQPPEITFYNMTSEGGEGCTSWNTDKSTACTTIDTTPTVRINTSENANCAIGVSNFNYTNLGPTRTCDGQGTQRLTCTLTDQDQLIDETSFIYIGCQDSFNFGENLTSTSGALKISLSQENTARVAIESGVNLALTSGYTIYTDQKIYARNSANSQFVARFDKVVKWLNKIWAFNFLTGNDTTTTTAFNITPVLYVLEMRNTTNSTINSTVYNLITATK